VSLPAIAVSAEPPAPVDADAPVPVVLAAAAPLVSAFAPALCAAATPAVAANAAAMIVVRILFMIAPGLSGWFVCALADRGHNARPSEAVDARFWRAQRGGRSRRTATPSRSGPAAG